MTTHEHLLMPHPVLRPEVSDYVEGTRFVMESKARHIKEDVVVDARLVLQCATLQQLISDNAASFYVMARCANTYHRHAASSKDPVITIKIPAGDLSGRLVLTPYVIASEQISDFVSEEHAFEVRNAGSVDIPPGSILAVGASDEVQLDKVGSLKSCIKLVPRPQVQKGTYTIEAESEFIAIAVDPEMYKDVFRMRTHANAIFYPSIYQAAIEYAIREMDEHPDSRWARALQKTLNDRNIKPDDSMEDAYLHAQALLEKPLARMVEWIKGRDIDE